MRTVKLAAKNLITDESGQDLIEYALIASLVSLTAISALGGLALKITALYAVITAGV